MDWVRVDGEAYIWVGAVICLTDSKNCVKQQNVT
jgi:hypothetical protein